MSMIEKRRESGSRLERGVRAAGVGRAAWRKARVGLEVANVIFECSFQGKHEAAQ